MYQEYKEGTGTRDNGALMKISVENLKTFEVIKFNFEFINE